MTKPITGVAMMILFEEGKWRLDDPVTKFVPEFANLKVFQGFDASGKPILVNARRPPTMREVMSHTAGFGYGLSDVHYVDQQFREKGVLRSNGLKEMIDRTATIPLMFQPGENWSYSSSVDIQGYIVEKITGQKFSDFLQQRLFGPLKMNDTFFTVPADKVARLGAVYNYDRDAGKILEATTLFGSPAQDFTQPPTMESGGGGLVSTTTDYARFAQMLANGGELDGARILAPATVELMGTNVIPRNVLVNTDGRGGTGARFNEAVGFGLDFMTLIDARRSGSLEGDGTISWGGAAGTWFWVDPTNDIIFVGMIQRYSGGPGYAELGSMTRTMVYSALVDPEK
jgi:CubicO group peptidase (beta-lactamase class C family)